MKTQNLMLFCYDFPHKKTQDFIIRLLVEGYKISYVLAAPWQKLNLSNSTVRIAPENVGLIHPNLLCKTFSIPYVISEHNNQKAIKYLKTHPVDLYIISGARILSENVIIAANEKILNIHPGLLPEVRGLDTLLWSIFNDHPAGISAHFISSKVDSGLFIYKETLDLKKDDEIRDISLRLLEKQTDILIKSLKILEKKEQSNLKNFNFQRSVYYSKMSLEVEEGTLKKFPNWLKNHL